MQWVKERDGLEDIQPPHQQGFCHLTNRWCFSHSLWRFKAHRGHFLLEINFQDRGCRIVDFSPNEVHRCVFFFKDSLLKLYSFKNSNFHFLFKIQKIDKTGPTVPHGHSQLELKRSCPLQMRHMLSSLPQTPPLSIASLKMKLNLYAVLLLNRAPLLIYPKFLPQ